MVIGVGNQIANAKPAEPGPHVQRVPEQQTYSDLRNPDACLLTLVSFTAT
jgi:hypothetical protein